jgi:carbamoylphosphate synthase large subunit
MNVLISGIGGPTPIGIAKSLLLNDKFKNIKLIGVDSGQYAAGLYNKDLFSSTYLIPHSANDNYWSILESIVRKDRIDYAFIVPELEVLAWSAKMNSDHIPCNSLLPEYRIAKILYDKWETYRRLIHTGLVPKTIEVDSQLIENSIAEDLGFPFWVRGGSGAGAVGSYKVNQIQDLNNWVKINPNIKDFIASEYLPGKIYACKVLFYQGQVIRAASAERIDYLMAQSSPSGISGMCARGKLINKADVVDRSIQALKTIFNDCQCKPHGMFTVDFREDKYGVPKITEINIRHVSFTYAFAACGANFSQDSLMLGVNDSSFDRNFRMYEFDDAYTFIRGVDSELTVLRDTEIKSNSGIAT